MTLLKQKSPVNQRLTGLLVGARGFEPPTPGPPDQYSNRAELRPELFLFRVHRFKFLNLI
jgi:hypothetical protein